MTLTETRQTQETEGTSNMYLEFLPLARRYLLQVPGRRYAGELTSFVDAVHRGTGTTGGTHTESFYLYLVEAIDNLGRQFDLEVMATSDDKTNAATIEVQWCFHVEESMMAGAVL